MKWRLVKPGSSELTSEFRVIHVLANNAATIGSGSGAAQ